MVEISEIFKNYSHQIQTISDKNLEFSFRMSSDHSIDNYHHSKSR